MISFAIVIGVSAGTSSESFGLVFSLTKGIIKKLLEITRNKKRNVIILLH